MEHQNSYPVHPLARLDGPLMSLGDAFADRFHSWHGASGRRYVMSVFAAEVGEEPPVFDSCVLVAVARDGRRRRALDVLVVERGGDLRQALARTDVDEWHVHLLAGDRHARAGIAADLATRLMCRRAPMWA